MLLHTVSKSPANNSALDSCLRSLADGAIILLLEDGVYAALQGSAWADAIADSTEYCYVIMADATARGLEDKLDRRFPTAGYDDFVRLSTECHAVQSWY